VSRRLPASKRCDGQGGLRSVVRVAIATSQLQMMMMMMMMIILKLCAR
jgi:hypothetical protein